MRWIHARDNLIEVPRHHAEEQPERAAHVPLREDGTERPLSAADLVTETITHAGNPPSMGADRPVCVS